MAKNEYKQCVKYWHNNMNLSSRVTCIAFFLSTRINNLSADKFKISVCGKQSHVWFSER